MYLAGLTLMQNGAPSYCIITTAANDSMQAVHDRMLLILSKEQAADWILDPSAIEDLLQLVPPMLEKENADAQLRFFLILISDFFFLCWFSARVGPSSCAVVSWRW